MSTIFKSGTWLLNASVTPLLHPPNHFHLRLTSRLLSAKRPDEQRTLFNLTADRATLMALANTIDAALNESP